MTIHGARSLDGFAQMPGCTEGLPLRGLDTGTVIRIRTRCSEYRLVVLEAPNQVLISGGALCPAPVEARIVGATATGGMVKTAWIGVGLRLEMRLDGHRVTTSTVESVAVDAVPYAIAV